MAPLFSKGTTNACTRTAQSAAPIVALLLVAGDACVIHTLNICYIFGSLRSVQLVVISCSHIQLSSDVLTQRTILSNQV